MTVRARSFTLLLISTLATAALAQNPTGALAQNVVSVDASAPTPPPETGYLHLGGSSSTGHSITVNSRYLLRDGKPWLPVMGEMHYTRVPEEQWESEILKMKAAGVDIIATYVFWIHHEEVEGKFDWSGRRDLRHFVELCAKQGMYVYLRPGPWAHGEARNGGFPDWVNKLPNMRTNDPVYLHDVELYFNQIGEQLHGLMFKDGGPIIGAQLENEYGQHGPGRGAEHILKLKQLAIAAGIDPPLFSVTGWPSLDFPPQEVIPVWGGYPDGFWYGSQENLPPSINYLFNFDRELGDMGGTVRSDDPAGKVDLKHDPYFAAEQGGGMASAYHRRPLISADDIAALTLTGIGSGINLYGYYMFHGGGNPKGVLSTLQESQATGYPNDLPEVHYDFQAPIGEFGQERESYRRTRLLHLFLNAYGSELAPMAPFGTKERSRDAADTATARVAVRTDSASGFIFVNNYARQLKMPDRPGFQVRMKLASGDITVPAKPVSVPAGSYFVWPFNLALGRATLRYSTAQLLTRLDTPTGRLVVLFAVPGVAPEFAFSAARDVSAAKGVLTRAHDTVTVTRILPGMNSTIVVTDADGAKTTLLLLTREQAEQVSMLHVGTRDALAMTASSLLFDGRQLHLRSITSPTQQVALLPYLHLGGAKAASEGLWSTYSFTQPAKQFELAVSEMQTATPRGRMEMGPYVDWRKSAVPTVPPEATFAQAATWKLDWKHADMTGLSQVLLDVNYAGDIGRLSSGETLLDDDFWNGLPWQVAVTPATVSLTLKVLPMPTVAPIYVDPSVRSVAEGAAREAKLIHAQLIPEYESVVTVTP